MSTGPIPFEQLQTLRDELRELDLSSQSKQAPELVSRYVRFYRLEFDGVDHRLGCVDTDHGRVVAHVWSKPDSRGTVMVVHGYFDHVGIVRNAIDRLLAEGYSVVAFDLPGHGLSAGPRGAIGDFAAYSDAFASVFARVRPTMAKPLFVVAHSTGCSTVMDFVLRDDESHFDRVVLVAPLVRTVGWRSSQLARAAVGSVAKRVPRVFRRNSSDDEYLDFVKNRDSLQFRWVPLSWPAANLKWANRFATRSESKHRVHIIQGKDDIVVDWRYNVPQIQRVFPDSHVTWIDDANHQLFNERAELRQRVLDGMVESLY